MASFSADDFECWKPVVCDGSDQCALYADLSNVQNGRLNFHPERLEDYHRLRDLLVTSFAVQYEKGLLRWPKSFGTKEQDRFPIIPAALHRARSEVDRALYHKESSFTRNGFILGEGRFSRILFEKGDVVATFKGEIINYNEVKSRFAEGNGGYMIKFKEDKYLDCWTERMSGSCMASYANSALGCYDNALNRDATNNCKLVVCNRNNSAKLKATVLIRSHAEIAWPNGNSYPFTSNHPSTSSSFTSIASGSSIRGGSERTGVVYTDEDMEEEEDDAT